MSYVPINLTRTYDLLPRDSEVVFGIRLPVRGTDLQLYSHDTVRYPDADENEKMPGSPLSVKS